MELRHLRYFVAVAEERNFTRAAERSFVAQSALSQQIMRLEKECKAPLFVRGNHRVELTAAGELLLPHARRILADVDNAQADLRSYLGLEKGKLRVGLIQTHGSATDIVGPIQRFHEAFPDIEIHLSNQPSKAMADDVQTGSLDLAVVGLGRADVPAGLEFHQLAVDPLVGVINSREANGLKGPISVKALLKHGQLISFAPGSGIGQQVDAAMRRANVEPSGVFELTQASDMVRFAAMGLGVTIVPRSLAEATRAEIEASSIGDYEIFELADKRAVHPISVVYDESRLSVAGRELLKYLAPK